jgi:hypothetical protein
MCSYNNSESCCQYARKSASDTIGNLLRVYERKEYEFPRADPWSNILASAAWAICSTFHTTLGATPGQLVYGRDMLFDLSLKANWKNIKEKKWHVLKNQISAKMPNKSTTHIV